MNYQFQSSHEWSYWIKRLLDKKLGVALVGLVLGLVGIIALLVGQYSTPAVPPKKKE